MLVEFHFDISDLDGVSSQILPLHRFSSDNSLGKHSDKEIIKPSLDLPRSTSMPREAFSTLPRATSDSAPRNLVSNQPRELCSTLPRNLPVYRDPPRPKPVAEVSPFSSKKV